MSKDHFMIIWLEKAFYITQSNKNEMPGAKSNERFQISITVWIATIALNVSMWIRV